MVKLGPLVLSLVGARREEGGSRSQAGLRFVVGGWGKIGGIGRLQFIFLL